MVEINVPSSCFSTENMASRNQSPMVHSNVNVKEWPGVFVWWGAQLVIQPTHSAALPSCAPFSSGKDFCFRHNTPIGGNTSAGTDGGEGPPEEELMARRVGVLKGSIIPNCKTGVLLLLLSKIINDEKKKCT